MKYTDAISLPRPQSIVPGDRLLYEESVFFKNKKKPFFAGKRSVAVVVVGPGIAGNFIVEILKCKGVNPFPTGVRIEKPMFNLLRSFLITGGSENFNFGGNEFEGGGHLEGVDSTGKKVILDNADKGGMSVGATHAQGGIKGDVQGKQIEFEDKEPVIVSEVRQDKTVYDFQGKKMSAVEMLSSVNVDNNGKAFEKGGDLGTEGKPIGFKGGQYILTAPVTSNPKKYNVNGKQMTGLEIASMVNQNNNGVAIAEQGMDTCTPCSK